MTKRIIAIAFTLAVVFSISVPVFAAPQAGGRTAVVQNAGFHCNTGGGNPRVRPDFYYDRNGLNGQREDVAIGLTEIPGTTTWRLTAFAPWKNGITYDDLTPYTGQFVCPACGRTDWITFSNRSGVPDGRNIQLNHPEVPTEPEKPEIPTGGFSVIKTTDGDSISELLSEEVRAGISFYAYPVSANGAAIPENATPNKGVINADGIVTFRITNPRTGWHAIREELSGKAAELFLTPKIQYFFVVFDESGNAISVNSAPVIVGGIAGGELEPAYAISARDYTRNEQLTAAKNTSYARRGNVSNAFGAPDVPRTGGGHDARMLALRFFNNVGLNTADIDSKNPANGVTFLFGADIFNNPGQEPDITVYEVTYDGAWYTEAADIYLINAVLNDGSVKEKLFVGTLRGRFNPSTPTGEVMESEGNPETGFRFEIVFDGNRTSTNIWLPDNIVKASAVRLVDVSDRFNFPRATSGRWWDAPGVNGQTSVSSGFDVDAIAAWFTGGEARFVNVLKSKNSLPSGGDS